MRAFVGQELYTFRSCGSWNFPHASESPWNLHTVKQREYTTCTRRNLPLILENVL